MVEDGERPTIRRYRSSVGAALPSSAFPRIIALERRETDERKIYHAPAKRNAVEGRGSGVGAVFGPFSPQINGFGRERTTERYLLPERGDTVSSASRHRFRCVNVCAQSSPPRWTRGLNLRCRCRTDACGTLVLLGGALYRSEGRQGTVPLSAILLPGIRAEGGRETGRRKRCIHCTWRTSPHRPRSGAGGRTARRARGERGSSHDGPPSLLELTCPN